MANFVQKDRTQAFLWVGLCVHCVELLNVFRQNFILSRSGKMRETPSVSVPVASVLHEVEK